MACARRLPSPVPTWSVPRAARTRWQSTTRRCANSTARRSDRIKPSRTCLPKAGPHRRVDQRAAPRRMGGRRAAGCRGGRGRPSRKDLLRAWRTGRMRDVDPGARRHRQHVGMPRTRLPAPGADRHRAVAREAGGVDHWTFVIRRRRPHSATGCAAGSPHNRANSRRRATSTGPRQGDWHRALYEAGFFGTVVAERVRWPRASTGLRRHRRRGDRQGRRTGTAQSGLSGRWAWATTAARSCSSDSCPA